MWCTAFTSKLSCLGLQCSRCKQRGHYTKLCSAKLDVNIITSLDDYLPDSEEEMYIGMVTSDKGLVNKEKKSETIVTPEVNLENFKEAAILEAEDAHAHTNMGYRM